MQPDRRGRHAVSAHAQPRAVHRVRGIPRHRPRLSGLRSRALRASGRLRSAARLPAARVGGRSAARLRRRPAARTRHLRDEAALRPARGPRHRPRQAARGGRDRLRPPGGLPGDAPRHAPLDGRGRGALPAARLRGDSALWLQSRGGNVVHGAGARGRARLRSDVGTLRPWPAASTLRNAFGHAASARGPGEAGRMSTR